VTPVVIDASAGVEILAHTAHGRRLAGLLPTDAVGYVPEHFYVEVAGVVRHQTVVTRTLTEETAEMCCVGSIVGICAERNPDR